MRLQIAAIGKLRSGPEADLIKDYLTRSQTMGRNLGFSGPEIAESEAPGNLPPAKRTLREGELLLKSVRKGERYIILDETGDNISSKKFASLLARYRDQGESGLTFLIGGADGHGEEIKRGAAQKISFGAATWPHLLVRVMLAEQVYRALTILSGHPYHRS